MNVDIYIYKRFDTDLLALYDAGYSLSAMTKEALISYANKKPCFFFVDEVVEFSLNDKKSVRIRFKINDKKAEELLSNIKKGFKSNFCKQILRNALIQQNLCCYISNSDYLELQSINASFLNMEQFPSVKKASLYKTLEKNITIMNQEVRITHKTGKKIEIAENTNKQVSITDKPQLTMEENLETKQKEVPEMISDLQKETKDNVVDNEEFVSASNDKEISQELQANVEHNTEDKQIIDESVPGFADDDELMNLFNGF